MYIQYVFFWESDIVTFLLLIIVEQNLKMQCSRAGIRAFLERTGAGAIKENLQIAGAGKKYPLKTAPRSREQGLFRGSWDQIR